MLVTETSVLPSRCGGARRPGVVASASRVGVHLRWAFRAVVRQAWACWARGRLAVVCVRVHRRPWAREHPFRGHIHPTVVPRLQGGQSRQLDRCRSRWRLPVRGAHRPVGRRHRRPLKQPRTSLTPLRNDEVLPRQAQTSRRRMPEVPTKKRTLGGGEEASRSTTYPRIWNSCAPSRQAVLARPFGHRRTPRWRSAKVHRRSRREDQVRQPLRHSKTSTGLQGSRQHWRSLPRRRRTVHPRLRKNLPLHPMHRVRPLHRRPCAPGRPLLHRLDRLVHHHLAMPVVHRRRSPRRLRKGLVRYRESRATRSLGRWPAQEHARGRRRRIRVHAEGRIDGQRVTGRAHVTKNQVCITIRRRQVRNRARALDVESPSARLRPRSRTTASLRSEGFLTG